MFFYKQTFSAAYRRMPSGRKTKIDSMLFAKDKALSLGAGVLLEKGLGDCGVQYRDAKIAAAENGKPCLVDGNVFFNVSHSGKFAAAAFFQNEVGVDIEEIRAIEELGVKDGDADFFKNWTRRESFAKCTGLGIADVNGCGQNEERFYFTEYNFDGYALCVCSKDQKFNAELVELKIKLEVV